VSRVTRVADDSRRLARAGEPEHLEQHREQKLLQGASPATQNVARPGVIAAADRFQLIRGDAIDFLVETFMTLRRAKRA
jgi:hypothetical protein